MDKKITKKIIQKDSYFSSSRYFTDNELKKVYPNFNKKINKFYGKKGDFLIIDTSKCLHMGSRDSINRFQMFYTFTPILTYDLNWNKNLAKYKDLNFKIEKELTI